MISVDRVEIWVKCWAILWATEQQGRTVAQAMSKDLYRSHVLVFAHWNLHVCTEQWGCSIHLCVPHSIKGSTTCHSSLAVMNIPTNLLSPHVTSLLRELWVLGRDHGERREAGAALGRFLQQQLDLFLPAYNVMPQPAVFAEITQ